MGLTSSRGVAYKEPQPVASKWFPDFEKDVPSLSGKTVVLTGTTSGTGFVCARTCARKGAARVVMLNRASPRAAAAQEAIAAEAAPGTVVETVECDCSDLDSVRAAAAKVRSTCPSVDVLCNNAGVMALEDRATKQGFDVQMATNHLSHFLLTSLLLPALERAAAERGEARVVNHSSAARKFPSTPLQAKYLGPNGGDLGGDSASMLCGGARWERYHQTKLANVVFTLGLHDRLAARDSKVKALVAAPGLAATNLQVTTHAAGGMGETWIMRFAQSAEDGTMPLLHCCTTPGLESGTMYEPSGMGAFAGPPGIVKLEPICTNNESREMLWAESEKAIGGPFFG